MGFYTDSIPLEAFEFKIDGIEVSAFDIIVLSIIIFGSIYCLLRRYHGKTGGKLLHRIPIKEDSDANHDEESARSLVTAAKKLGNKVIFLFGSQTGTAEIFASRLAKEGSARFGLQTMTADLEDYDYADLDRFPRDAVLVFILSTYGEGEPTDNAQEFFEFFTAPESEFSNGSMIGEFLTRVVEDDSAYGSGGSAGSSDLDPNDEIADSDSQLPLRNLNFGIFGLGNTTYEHYNAVSRRTDLVLRRLGAKRIGPLGLGDDSAGSTEDELLSWKETFWGELYNIIKYVERPREYVAQIELRPSPWDASNPSVYLGEPNRKHLYNLRNPPYSAHHPLMAKVKVTRELFASKAARHCVHLELDLAGSALKYETGDHAVIWPINPDSQVDRLLSILDLDEKRNQVFRLKGKEPSFKVPVPEPTTYDTVLRYYLDICGPVSRDFLQNVSHYAPTEEANRHCINLSNSRELFHEQVMNKYKTLADVLESMHPKWPNIPFTLLIESLLHLQPRFYSISSSPLYVEDNLSVTAVVTELRDAHNKRYFAGVSTNYLLAVHNAHKGIVSDIKYDVDGPRGRFCNGQKLLLHIRKSTFRLPEDQITPIIMVGPGTGIAPFRGFIQDKIRIFESGIEVGKCLLLYGCRKRDEDFIYEEQWQEAESKLGDRFKMVTAFSRETPGQKTYVQHLMVQPELSSTLRDLILNRGAHFYICGDALNMARDVTRALAEILGPQGNQTIKEMKSNGRFQEDIWS